MGKTDEQLVARYISGDEQALEALVDSYLKPLYNFTFRLVGDSAAAEDIVQEVFVKVWKNIAKYEADKKFSTWIFAIAKNTAYDWLKKKKSIPFAAFEKEDGTNLLEYVEDETILHSHALLQKMDDAKNAQEFLNSLSPQNKTILLLHHKHGFALSEIAEIMGHSNNTIKSKYRRAILSLRNQFSS
jgi:RNA polymerase sigma-70 factor, ECF subfamily